MYGIINKSLKEMMVEQFGEDRWLRALEKSGVPADSFLTMRSYDDAITYQLATSAAAELGIDLSEALKAFGVHWVEHTLKKQYSTLASSTGDDLISFLQNLNGLHDRISSTFLDYQPPQFLVESHDDGTFTVVYSSHREGLTPFVEGLLQGLGSRFDQKIEIINIEIVPTESGEHSRFHIRVD